MTYRDHGKWDYIGDVNISYGGTFIRDDGDRAFVVKISDLSDEVGEPSGRVIVESDYVSIPSLNTVRAAYAYADVANATKGMKREWRRFFAWLALRDYVGFDSEPTRTVLQFESGPVFHYGKFRPDYFVEGDKGIRLWVAERYDIPNDVAEYL